MTTPASAVEMLDDGDEGAGDADDEEADLHPGNSNPSGNAFGHYKESNAGGNGVGNGSVGGNNGGGSGGGSPGKGTILYEPDMYYYHPDHLGSTSYVTDIDGEMYQHLAYFPFGETWVEEVSNQHRVPYLFTAKELDRETGLYYFGARYYDPRTSVWTSCDPILGSYFDKENDQNIYNPFNLAIYTYGYNNPVICFDPDGNFIVTAIVVAGAAWTAYDAYKAGENAYNETGEIGEAIKAGAVSAGKDVVMGAALGGAGKLGGKVIGKGAKLLMKSKLAKKVAKGVSSKVARLMGKAPKMIANVADDPAAQKLAQRLGGKASVTFPGRFKNREFDVLSDLYIGQTKPANFKLGSSFRAQAKATFEAAKELGKKPYFHFDGPPDSSVINKLAEYGRRYGIKPVIDINKF